MKSYLPKDNQDSELNKSILRSLWNNKLISRAVFVKNEADARYWFSRHPKNEVEARDWFR
jgi:hypothetical protein